jgi:L-cystine uptake protein TcyP (sodium:dicarboxylate symporter family)
LFYFLITVDALTALVAGYFFVIGIGDKTISSSNLLLWLQMLASIALVMGSGIAFRRYGHRVAANLVLAVLGVPAVLYGVLILIAVIAPPRWN